MIAGGGGVIGSRRSTGFVGTSAGGAGFVGAYDAIPSIVAAYGMRRLRSTYTGVILRIRRSSDSAEQDIGYTATGDLDTAAVASFIGGGSGYIVNWYDQSGNGYTAAQATPGSQPLYVASGQNGRPVGRWDGVNDWLIMPNVRMGFPTGTFLFSFRGIISGTAELYTQRSANSDNPELRFAINGAMALYYSGAYQHNAADFAPTTSFVLAEWSLSGATAYSSWRNGTSIVSNKTLSAAPSNTPTNHLLGGRNYNGNTFANGDIAELIICNAALSTPDRQAAEAAANSYWNIF